MTDVPLSQIAEEKLLELVERLDVRGPRYTSYPTVPVWQNDFPAEPYARALNSLGQDGKPIAVYLHFPFCKSRCLYCGCNSYISNDAERIGNYSEALKAEIERVTSEFQFPVQHAQLHLGGGTPTHTPPDQLADIIDFLIARIPGAEAVDRSVEVDPRVTTDEQLRVLSERGFKRISIGLQDLDDRVQQAIRRSFSFEQTRDFIVRARTFGFTSVNVDLIYGLPLQTRKTWTTTLNAAAKLDVDRFACFGYAHLPEKIKHQQAIHQEDLPSSRTRLGMLLDAHRFFIEHGLAAIGLDHFAKPDDDLSSAQRDGRLWRNFMGYTTIRGMELLGLGCSGISEFRDLYAQNIVAPEPYGEAVRMGKLPVRRGHLLDEDDRATKHLINDLMCNLDIRLPEEAVVSGNGLRERLEETMASLEPFANDGLILRTAKGYRVTEIGQLFVRNLAMPFDRYLPKQEGVTFSRTV